MIPQYRSVRDTGVASATGNSDLQLLHDLRFEYPKKFAVWVSEYKQSPRKKIHH